MQKNKVDPAKTLSREAVISYCNPCQLPIWYFNRHDFHQFVFVAFDREYCNKWNLQCSNIHYGTDHVCLCRKVG